MHLMFHRLKGTKKHLLTRVCDREVIGYYQNSFYLKIAISKYPTSVWNKISKAV